MADQTPTTEELQRSIADLERALHDLIQSWEWIILSMPPDMALKYEALREKTYPTSPFRIQAQ